jgi:hypothetical protein
MKVKMVEGKHAFDYKLDGVLFLPSERVCVLDRNSGEQRVISTATLQDVVGDKKFDMIRIKLMHTNLFSNDNYEVMGLADVDPAQEELI